MTPTDDCPLDAATQKRNLILFAACTALQYLSAPITYVGVVQAPLCKKLGSSDRVANLPETAFFALTITPVFLTWLIPYVNWLKRNLVMCYLAGVLSLIATAVVLAAPLPDDVKIAAVIGQAGVLGIVFPTGIAFLWEILGRGTASSRRGLALSLAFGFGPLFAVGGSLASQLILEGSLGPLQTGKLDFPFQFVLLYAAGIPVMGLAALLATFFVVPTPEREAVREPFGKSVFGGLGDFFRDPVLRLAAVAILLLYIGNTITSNLNLYSKEVFNRSSELDAGYQNAVRFAFKMGAGLLLGWLLARSNPRLGVLLTGAIFLAAVVLAIFATPAVYLLVFGLYGAGELIGVYGPNYILSASRPQDIRRNMAFVTMLMAPAAPAGYLFGLISDVGAQRYGAAAGFRLSFAACALIMLVGILLACLLPARPAPRTDSATP